MLVYKYTYHVAYGNRISFDEISEQLRSIYGVMLCYIQDEIQNDAPYLVRYGQFESVIGNLCKKATNGFIRLKSLHRTQDVILHHCQGETCDLGGKMYGLALAQVQQGLTVLVCDFGSPASGVYTICLKETEGKVGCQQAVPITFATSFAEEQTNRYTIQLNVHGAICAAKSSVVLACLRLLLVPDDLLGIHLTRFRGVVSLAQLYHAQQMTDAYYLYHCHYPGKMSYKQFVGIIQNTPSFLKRKIEYNLFALAHLKTDPVYTLSSVNDYGDVTWHWYHNRAHGNLDGLGMDRGNQPFNEYAFNYMVSKMNELKKRGVRIVMYPAAFERRAFDGSRKTVSYISNRLLEAGYPYVCYPIECTFDTDKFYDTNYHLNHEGALLHNQHIIGILKSKLFQK